ncbi:MAG TPA: MFS transporter [Candidatus Eisenbacteria bacterium]
MSPLVLLCAFLEGMALTLIQGYLPLYLRGTLGETRYVTIGLLVAVPSLGTVIASNFWGGLSDVTGRLKPAILVGLAGYALALAGIPPLRHGLGVLGYVGLCSLLYGTLAPSLKATVTLARPERKEHAIAYVLMAQGTGWLVGSYGAGSLLENGLSSGIHFAMWVAAGLFVLQGAAVAALHRDQRRPPPPTRERTGRLRGVIADLEALYENPRLLRLCVLTFFFVSANYIVWGFFTVFLTEHIGVGMRVLRDTLMVSAIAGVSFMPFVGPLVKRYGPRLLLAIGVTLYLGMYVGMGTLRDPVALALCFAMPLYGLVNVSANTLATEYASASQRGGGLGVLNGTYALASVAGPIVGGLMADRIGIGSVPWTALGFMLVATPIAWAGAMRRRNAD